MPGKSNRGGRAIGHSIAPIPPARYPSIPNKHVIFFHTLMSEIVPDNIIFLTPLFFFRLLQLESAAEDRIGTAATRRQALQLVRAEIARLAEAVVHPGQIHGSRVAVEIHIVPKFAGTRAGRRPVKRVREGLQVVVGTSDIDEQGIGHDQKLIGALSSTALTACCRVGNMQPGPTVTIAIAALELSSNSSTANTRQTLSIEAPAGPREDTEPDGTNTPAHNVKTNSCIGARQHSVHV